MKNWKMALIATSLIISAQSFAKNYQLDDLNCTQDNYSMLVISSKDIDQRAVGVSFSYKYTAVEKVTLRLICTDKDITNCNKYRFITSVRNSKNPTLEVQGVVLRSEFGPLDQYQVDRVMEKLALQAKDADMFGEFDLDGVFKGFSAGIKIAERTNNNGLRLLTGLVAIPAGLVFDLIASPVSGYQYLAYRHKENVEANKLAEKIRTSKRALIDMAVLYPTISSLTSFIRKDIDAL